VLLFKVTHRLLVILIKVKSVISEVVVRTLMINLVQELLTKNLFLIQKETFTKMINAGTSTKGPITPANA